MAKIINLPKSTALMLNEFRKSIKYMQTVNTDGKYNDQIELERSAVKHDMDVILGRKAEAA